MEQEEAKARQERECIHRGSGATGRFYNGMDYINHLQSLKGEKAVRFAGRVGAFFWADANYTLVWLCEGCASELGME